MITLLVIIAVVDVAHLLVGAGRLYFAHKHQAYIDSAKEF